MSSNPKPSSDRLSARICRWYGGKRAALSLRFDDSNRTHIERAVPWLNEYGLIGTFLVNPGKSSYQQYKSTWEGAVIEQGHELGDHTLTHNGARTDREAEREIGEPAKLLHRLQPDVKLLTFLSGGATLWMQRKSFDFFTAKYDLSRGSYRSMSCSEDYPSFSFEAFKQRMDEGMAEGDSLQFHFHPIGEGHLHITPPLFRRLLEYVQSQKENLWQAGMSAINQYWQERDNAALWAHPTGDDTLALQLACATDPDFYNEPLTLEVDLPPAADALEVCDAAGKALPSRIERAEDRRVVRFDVAPVDAAYTVRAKGLGAAYLKAHGPGLAAPGPHPYLFFSRDELAALLEKTKQAPAAGMWQHIKAEADELAGGDPSEWTAESSHWENSRRLRTLAFVYALTGQELYARRAVTALEALLADTGWLMPQAEALVTAEATCSLALAYDWMYDALTEAQRKQIREAVINHGIKPMLAAIDQGEWWTHWYRCNWGGVILGQVGVAALSLLGEEPQAADWARLFQLKTWHYPQALDREGGWGESGSYGTYIWFRAVLYADALQRVTKGQVNLFQNAKLPRLAQWFINIMEPDERSFIPFSNCGQGTDGTAPILYRLAREYRDGYAQWFAQTITERRDSGDIFSFLWCDPALEARDPGGLPLDKLFPDISWAPLRNRWHDPQAILFALKGGQKDWDHHHHDTNSFVLYAYGRPLLVDLLYPHQVWGCQTEAHNTIMVNGKEQLGDVHVAGSRGDPRHRGIVSDLMEAPWYARLVGDASLAYDPKDVNSFVREVMYLRHSDQAQPPDYFVLFDDVDAVAPSRVDWLLHTYGDMKVDGSRITVTQDQAAVDVTMVAPQAFASEIRERTFEEAGSDRPFETARAFNQLTLRPAEQTPRTYFLSVLAPRPATRPAGKPASASPDTTLRSSDATSLRSTSDVQVAPIREPNVLGASIVTPAARDVALFALDQPEIKAAGVEAVGRSCFVRRAGEQVTRAALHRGQRLSADGVLLFETSSSGDAVLTFDADATEAKLNLYDSMMVRIHCHRPPAKVLVDGKEAAFEYEPDRQCVRLERARMQHIRILLQQ